MRVVGIFGGLVGLFLVFGASQAQAASPIAGLTINAQLQTDGAITVNQEINYYSPNPLHWTVFGNIRDTSIQADGETISQWQIATIVGGKAISSSIPASHWQVSYRLTSALIRHNDRDQVYIKIFEQPGVPVENVRVTLELPGDVPAGQLTGNTYAIGGNQFPTSQVNSPHSLSYAARFSGDKAVFTVSASWPKGVFQLSRWQNWRLALSNLEAVPWLTLGILLPLLAAALLLSLLWTIKKSERETKQIISQPPSALSPILVGVLVNKKVYPEEIMALLVDLCQRGYLVIVKKHDQYYLTQRALPDEHLQAWEHEILDQLFPAFGSLISEQSARALGGNSLFSPRVRDAFDQIYQVVTEIGAFKENPHLTRIRYKLIGLTCYFAALVGLVWTVVVNASALLLIPLIGTLVLAYVTVRLSPQLIRYTAKGEQERERWQAFGNYLCSSTPLGLEAAQNHQYEKYLGYAIALHQSSFWASRFETASTVIARPDWFVSYAELGPEQLASELTAFTGILAEELTKLHGPLVG